MDLTHYFSAAEMHFRGVREVDALGCKYFVPVLFCQFLAVVFVSELGRHVGAGVVLVSNLLAVGGHEKPVKVCV